MGNAANRCWEQSIDSGHTLVTLMIVWRKMHNNMKPLDFR